MNELKVFKNSEFGELGILTIDGKEYFPATHCAKTLGYSNPRDAIKRHCNPEGIVKHDGVSYTTNQHGVTTQQVVDINYITEGNLYRLIARSKLPEAERFERWVFDEVLPELHRNGSYGNINIEEIISRTATAVVSEVVKQLVPIISSFNQEQARPNFLKPAKRFKRTQPSKIDLLPPELKERVDDMICSGEYSCQAVSNYINNKSGIYISQMAINRCGHRNFWD